MKPGVTGNSIDVIAREILVDAGYPEYQHARSPVGARGARWRRPAGSLVGEIRDDPRLELEVGQVFTIEPGMAVPNYGYVALEEDVVMTESGANYIGEPQRELILIKAEKRKLTADLRSAVRFKRPNPCSYGDKLSKNKRRLFLWVLCHPSLSCLTSQNYTHSSR